MKLFRRFVVAAAIAGPLPFTPAFAQSDATAMDDRWHFFVAPYLWATGMEGRVGVNDALSVPVDVSFGEVIENLDFGLLGRFEGRKNRAGFGIDLAYMNLGVDVAGSVDGEFGLGAEARSLTAEGIFLYRVVNADSKAAYVDVLGGARYMGNRAGLTLERDGDEIVGSSRTLNWVDALVGARFRLPLGEKAGLHGRSDVAFFGSDLSWNVQGGLDVLLGQRWKTGAGYRYLDVDYDKGEGLERRIWKIAYSGPYVFVGYSW